MYVPNFQADGTHILSISKHILDKSSTRRLTKFLLIIVQIVFHSAHCSLFS